MAATEPRYIEWDSAQITDATLTVALAGSSSKDWKARFDAVVALLDTPHANWGEVRVTKKGIAVAEVQEGSESDLRHFLESVVLQANSDTAPNATREDADADPGAGEPDADQRMTATFRAFASDDG